MYWIILKIWLFFWIITHRIIRRNLLQKIIDRSILFSLPNKRIHNDNLYNKILLRNNRTTRRSNYKFSEMKRTRIILVYECDTKKYPNDTNPNRTTNLTKISYLHAFIQDAFYDSNAGLIEKLDTFSRLDAATQEPYDWASRIKRKEKKNHHHHSVILSLRFATCRHSASRVACNNNAWMYEYCKRWKRTTYQTRYNRGVALADAAIHGGAIPKNLRDQIDAIFTYREYDENNSPCEKI